MVSLKIFGTILMQLFAVLFWEHHFSHNKVHGNNSEQILVLQFVHRIFKICTFSLLLNKVKVHPMRAFGENISMKLHQLQLAAATFQTLTAEMQN